jgi:hypothetical protein
VVVIAVGIGVVVLVTLITGAGGDDEDESSARRITASMRATTRAPAAHSLRARLVPELVLISGA